MRPGYETQIPNGTPSIISDCVGKGNFDHQLWKLQDGGKLRHEASAKCLTNIFTNVLGVYSCELTKSNEIWELADTSAPNKRPVLLQSAKDNKCITRDEYKLTATLEDCSTKSRTQKWYTIVRNISPLLILTLKTLQELLFYSNRQRHSALNTKCSTAMFKS